MIGVLRRLFHKLRAAFPHARLRVRLDGGFASPAVFAFLEAEGVEYLVAMASNARLEKRIRRLLGNVGVRLLLSCYPGDRVPMEPPLPHLQLRRPFRNTA